MTPAGFLACLDDRVGGVVTAATRFAGPGDAVIVGRGFALYARAARTTPEARSEAQPLVADDLFLVYAGRIDNRRVVTSALSVSATAGDGDLMMAAYRRWGSSFPSRLTGEYCFALLDRRNGRVFCGRDALGIRKLYVRRTRSGTLIASSLDLLVASLERRPAIDRDALADYVALGGMWGAAGATVYAGVRSCPAGHVIGFEPGREPTCCAHWTPDADGDTRRRRADEYDEQFRELIFGAVRQALRARGTVALELSGGLDSSSVTCVAALAGGGNGARAQAPLVAYSLIDAGDRQADETAYQRAVVSRYGVRHYAFGIDDGDRGLNPEAIAQPDMLMAQSWMLAAQHRLAAAVSPAVCLTGHGGDAVFCAGPLHVFRWTPLDAWRRWRVGRRSVRGRDAGRPGPEWLAPVFREAVRDIERRVSAGPPRVGRTATREHHRRLIANLAASLPDDSRLPWEPRYPLLNKDLVEFMLALPWDQKITGGDTRLIQRRALASVLPDAVRLRRTKADFTRRMIRSLSTGRHWERIARGVHLHALGIVRQPHFSLACERLQRGLITDDVRYYVAALTIEAWLLGACPPAAVSESRNQRVFGDPIGRLVDRGIAELDPGMCAEGERAHADAEVCVKAGHS
jgi:asparagine synthase (glutamine-hydrolysing)